MLENKKILLIPLAVLIILQQLYSIIWPGMQKRKPLKSRTSSGLKRSKILPGILNLRSVTKPLLPIPRRLVLP